MTALLLARLLTGCSCQDYSQEGEMEVPFILDSCGTTDPGSMSQPYFFGCENRPAARSGASVHAVRTLALALVRNRFVNHG